jgi:acyl-coenzyme A synthetase/AMP-(fatty) acid ligase
MGHDCQLEVKLVNEIPKTPSGKYRYTISMIEQND